MTVRDLIGTELKLLGKSKVTISSATTTSFDFGTPDDLNLAALANYRPGDRILVLFDTSSAGTTDTVSFVVQDAPDSSGSIGSAATAVTDGTLTGGTGDQYAWTGVQLQAGRPWLRCRVTSTGATDTFIAQCTVLSVPRALV
jgi:hypothetical protein